MRLLTQWCVFLLLLGGTFNLAFAYCTPPQNPRCERVGSINYLAWDPMPGVTHYEIEIEYDSGRCSSCSGISWTTGRVLVAGTRYRRPNHPCFAWRVRPRLPINTVDCDESAGPDPDWTDWQCGNNVYQCPEVLVWMKNGTAPKLENSSVEAWPNPVTNQMQVRIDLPNFQDVEVSIYDLTGRRVGLLHSGNFVAGVHELSWTPKDHLPNGIYLLRVRGEGADITKKIVLDRNR